MVRKTPPHPLSFVQNAGFLACTFTLSAACSPPPPEAHAPQTVPSVSATMATPPPATGSSAATTAPLPSAVSTFIAVSDLPGPCYLFPGENTLLLGREQSDEIKPEGTWGVQLGAVEGDRPDFSRKLHLPGMHLVIDMRGTWPTDVSILAIGDTGRTGIAERWVLDNKGLSRASGDIGFFFVGAANVGPSVVALHAPGFPGGQGKITTVRGPSVSYKLTPGDPKACEWQKTALMSEAFGTAGDGTLLSYGATCDGAKAVESWASPGSPPVIATLPKNDLERPRDAYFHSSRILTGPGKQAWILHGGIHHYDGSAWKTIEPPVPGESVLTGALSPDGTLWLISASHVVWAYKDGAFRKEPLPDDAEAQYIAATADGTVWISTASALLRTRRPGDGNGVKVDAKKQPPPKRRPFISPGTPSCTSNIVVLYGFTKVTPDDYDFPLTRKALRGHKEYSKTRFVVTKDNNQKYFTAMVPDYETGKKLVALIEKQVQGSKPQLVCAEPEVIREVKLDLATGEVIK